MSKEIKYYKLEELKIGMRVFVDSLNRIYDTPIYLDSKSFEASSKNNDWRSSGVILFIGSEDYFASGKTPSDVVMIWNVEEEIAYDSTEGV